MKVNKETVPEISDAFEEAIRCKACGNGMIPYRVYKQLTKDEWDKIVSLSGTEARRMVRQMDSTKPNIDITRVIEELEAEMNRT